MEQYRLLKKEECDIHDAFWNRYIRLVKEEVIPYQWEILNDKISGSEPSHAIDNFRIAAGQREGRFYGEVFQDSDVYKWLEAAGNILLLERDGGLEEKADLVIDIIAGAQEKDGYLNTYFTIEAPEKKWTNVLECHELYCAGHFLEGAAAYYRATGKEQALQIAVKLADHICDVFGEEEGQLHGYPGHQEIEIGLLKLYDLTQEEKYMELAAYFINTRGTNDFFEAEFLKRNQICFWTKGKVETPNRRYNQFPYPYYNQFHLPVREQKEAVGHAVRGVYMYTAMADIAGRTQDADLFEACKALWGDIVNSKMYITGGIGTTPSGEAFTIGYDLPNDTNYSETCASIGLMFFAQRMLKAEVNRIYGDIIERVLYNALLGSMNYDGNRFFYVNPMEVIPERCRGNAERNHVKPIRQKWFSCACCPPNIARTLGGLWEYIYTVRKNTAYVHLFIGSEARIRLETGVMIIRQETEYPRKNKITLNIQADIHETAAVAIRIPGYSKAFRLYINGIPSGITPDESGYIYIERSFLEEVEVILEPDMKPRLLESCKKVHYNAGRAAIVRGPVVYCLEETDNGPFLNQISLCGTAPLEEVETDLWGGCVFIKTMGYRKEHRNADDGLYVPYEQNEREIMVTAVPYYLWNNRQPGEMQVFIRVK